MENLDILAKKIQESENLKKLLRDFNININVPKLRFKKDLKIETFVHDNGIEIVAETSGFPDLRLYNRRLVIRDREGSRDVDLTEELDTERIESIYKNGILTILIPFSDKDIKDLYGESHVGEDKKSDK